MNAKNLHRFFNPKTIAIVGATNKRGHVGYALMENLTSSGYSGKVYPVNPKRKRVRGLDAYESIAKIQSPLDLVIIATPAKTIFSIIQQCVKQDVGGIVITSSGFQEIGIEGKTLFSDIQKLALKHNINILGPNCLGFIRPSLSLNASFTKQTALPGKIAFISQSGALCSAILDWSIKEKLGFSYFISVGEMIDIGFSELIDYLGNDPNVGSILIYMESLTNAKRFLSSARAYARNKPIMVLKSGKSDQGARAALSHTGGLSGNNDVFNAAFERVGILRVDSISQLFNCAVALDMQPIPRGNRLAILTNAGGPGVLATDVLVSWGGELAPLSTESLNILNSLLPASWSHGNPIDILGDAKPEHFKQALAVCLNDPSIDGILIVLTPQSMTDVTGVAHQIIQMTEKKSKTVLTSFMGEKSVDRGKTILESHGIPCYKTPEEAVKSFMYMYRYGKNLELLSQTPSSIPSNFSPNTKAVKEIIHDSYKKKRYVLTEFQSKKILSLYEIATPQSQIAKNADQVVHIAKQLGFPVAIKVLSPDIYHKTEAGANRLHIRGEVEATHAYHDVITHVKENNISARIDGVLVEKMITKKYELFFGCKKFPIFGPAIVFGMGGVAVEVFHDVKMGLPPLNMALAKRLIESTKIHTLLKGYRGMKGINIEDLAFTLYKFAYLICDMPEIKEIDVNPYVVDEQGGIVLDAKIILDESLVDTSVKKYSHLTITPYPKEYISHFKLKSGAIATLRPILPEDEPLEAAMFKHFSQDTQRFRFFSLLKEVTHEMLVRYTQIDYDREMAIIAEIQEGGRRKMIGVARIIANSTNENAEFAIVVADPWQRQGLGSKLMDTILHIAKEKGINTIYAYFLEDNMSIREMFKQRGFKISPKDGNYFAQKTMNEN